jgi:hypothetical protein
MLQQEGVGHGDGGDDGMRHIFSPVVHV